MTSTRVILYDDSLARAAEPFALTRPFGELRAGAALIRERWERLLGLGANGFVGAAHLASFEEPGAPPAAGGILSRGTIVVNARCAAHLWLSGEPHPLANPGPGDAIEVNGAVAAVVLAADVPVASLDGGATALGTFAKRTTAKVPGWWMEHTWDLIRHLPDMLAADTAILAGDVASPPPAHLTVLGEHAASVAPGAYVEPHVVFDTTAGGVVVMSGARINAFTRIAGPAVIGPDSVVSGGRFSGVAIGNSARVCGEMSTSVVIGHANKGHDGFVGHSVIGRWANFGAGTTTSNLKNSYGPVRLRDGRGDHDTGMQFLGSLIGDHAKLAIGTRLMTGTIVGAGANVFGDRSPAKYVPPFLWGDQPPFKRYELGKFLEVAAHVMGRRNVTLSSGMRDVLAAAWAASA